MGNQEIARDKGKQKPRRRGALTRLGKVLGWEGFYGEHKWYTSKGYFQPILKLAATRNRKRVRGEERSRCALSSGASGTGRGQKT